MKNLILYFLNALIFFLAMGIYHDTQEYTAGMFVFLGVVAGFWTGMTVNTLLKELND